MQKRISGLYLTPLVVIYSQNMSEKTRKCRDCKQHKQFLTPETWLIVQKFKANFNKEHIKAGGITKSDAVNNIIIEWDKLTSKAI